MKLLATLLSIGLPWIATHYLMENLPLLQPGSGLMQYLAKILSMKLARRLVSFILPIVISGVLVWLAVEAGVFMRPVGWPEWVDLIWAYSGLSALLPQLSHAYSTRKDYPC